MSPSARITVTAGPDKGRVYDLTGEMVRLGRAQGNEVVFSDPQMDDQHASIVCREGRFAIFTSVADGLEIDGTDVPPERWVWLPESATIRLGARTSVEFVAAESPAAPPQERRASERPPAGGGAAEGTSRPAGAGTSSTEMIAVGKTAAGKGRRSVEVAAPGSDERPRQKRSAERGEKKTRTLARFITDGPGDPLVKLGEDGHLPELTLHEAQAREKPDSGPKQSNPTLLIVALAMSFGLTILMLLMDSGDGSDNQAAINKARQEIKEYYGKPGETLAPYQEVLRTARLAWSRRDFEDEKKAYREVLSLLRSEAKDKLNKYTGLTGRIDYDPDGTSKKSDKRLEELIGILLSE